MFLRSSETWVNAGAALHRFSRRDAPWAVTVGRWDFGLSPAVWVGYITGGMPIVARNAENRVEAAFQLGQERYAEAGVDVAGALQILAGIPLSLHCWQGDDVGGFESFGSALGGGLAVTGNYRA